MSKGIAWSNGAGYIVEKKGVYEVYYFWMIHYIRRFKKDSDGLREAKRLLTKRKETHGDI
jgi:hypothetical protein